jgi:hypothetical protein
MAAAEEVVKTYLAAVAAAVRQNLKDNAEIYSFVFSCNFK